MFFSTDTYDATNYRQCRTRTSKKAGLEEIIFIHLQGLIPVSAEKISGLIDVSGKTARGSDLCKNFIDEFKLL